MRWFAPRPRLTCVQGIALQRKKLVRSITCCFVCAICLIFRRIYYHTSLKMILIQTPFTVMETLEKEWDYCNEFIKDFKRKVSKHYLITGGIIDVEAHKNTLLKSKRGKNRKAGRPHVHIVTVTFLFRTATTGTRFAL